MWKYFMKPPFLNLVCFGRILNGYEVQLWTYKEEQIFSDPYAWLTFD